MPRGHLGDFTPEDVRSIAVAQGGNGNLVAV